MTADLEKMALVDEVVSRGDHYERYTPLVAVEEGHRAHESPSFSLFATLAAIGFGPWRGEFRRARALHTHDAWRGP